MKYWIFTLIVFVQSILLAQDSTATYHTKILPGVFINVVKIDFKKDAEIKLNKYELNSFQVNFSNQLHQASLANVRNYGPSQLSTISIRGLGSQHVATLWNGLNLTNTMHGTADASLLIPYSLLQSNSIKYGSSVQQGSNNNVAGSINQTSFIDAEHGLDLLLSMHFGSFQKHQQYIGIKNTQTKYTIGVDFFHDIAKNNFAYKTNPASKNWDKTNRHSAHDIYQTNGIFLYQINRFIQFKTAVSYTQAYRQMAASMFEASNDAIQKDAQLKSYLTLLIYKYKWQLNITNGYAYENLYFEKKSATIFSKSKLHKNVTQVTLYFPFTKNHHLYAKLENNISIAKNESYTTTSPTQNILSGIVNYRYETTKITTSLSLHQQIVNTKMAPFLFDAEASYRLKKSFVFSVKGARIYRYPTLNDLYWAQGGNEYLQPEKGWNIEYSLFVKAEKNRFYFDTKATNFYYWINNWIQWTPTNLAYWTPKNTKKVFSRGIELQSQVKYEYKTLLLNLRTGYSYTLPTQISDGDLYGKQLIYESRHKLFVNFNIDVYHVNLAYSFQYTGSRFTSSDNAYSLSPFQTSDLKIGYDFNKNNMRIQPYFSVQNLTNSSYQMMQGRPMMGRNYMLGISFSFHQKPNYTYEK